MIRNAGQSSSCSRIFSGLLCAPFICPSCDLVDGSAGREELVQLERREALRALYGRADDGNVNNVDDGNVK